MWWLLFVVIYSLKIQYKLAAVLYSMPWSVVHVNIGDLASDNILFCKIKMTPETHWIHLMGLLLCKRRSIPYDIDVTVNFLMEKLVSFFSNSSCKTADCK